MKKKILQLLIATSVLALPFSAQAATKINNVNIKIAVEDDMEDDEITGIPELEVSGKAKTYSVDGYEITIGLDGNEINPYDDDDDYDDDQDEENGPGASSKSTSSTKKKTVPKGKTVPVTCEITLSAETGYYFNTMSKKNIKINGLDANCTKASRQDSGKTMILTVQLPGIKTRVGKPDNATWKDISTATWSAAQNACLYELRLYKDDKASGKTYQTSAESFNFAPLMLKSGQYSYTVKAIDKDGETGKRVRSDDVFVSEELAEQNKEAYKVIYDEPVPGAGPDALRNVLNGGWQEKDGKYWYRMNDGTYPQANWLQLGDDWYYFDEEGFMVSNEAISWKGEEYTLGADGKMLSDAKTSGNTDTD